ncbi:hypothetical protein B0O99DRAFT_634290 [Bisporella sp. PMI_857]|nr:hypothetical protein B0O99DRAFT_634290 [Bisporella sp. PMI_857]
MHHVYSNSTMSIAAPGASDSTQGCFFERNQADVFQAINAFTIWQHCWRAVVRHFKSDT